MSRARAIIIIFLLAGGVYLGTLGNGFVFDDNIQVLKNPWITDIGYIPDIVTSSVWAFDVEGEERNFYYRPFLHLSYMAEYHLFGFKAWGWHFINLILHGLNAIVVFMLASVLLATKRGSNEPDISGDDTGGSSKNLFPFIAALIFALHPINTEVVSWVACVTELLFTLFFFLSFYLYMGAYCSSDSGGRDKCAYSSPLSYLFFFLAALSKETAIMLPFLLAVYDYSRGLKLRELPVKKYLPYFIIAAVYLVIRSYALQGEVSRRLYFDEPVLQVVNFFPVLLKYFGKLLVPIDLSPFYIFKPVASFLDGWLLVSIVIVFILAVLLWRYKRSEPALPLFAAIIFLPLAPTFYLLFSNAMEYHISIPSDRYLYLPTAGFAMLAAYLLRGLTVRCGGAGRARPLFIGLVIVALLYAYGTVTRTFDWKSDYTLWSTAVETDPDNYFVHNAMAEQYRIRGRYEEELSELLEVGRLRPGHPALKHDLGKVYFALGRLEEAAREFVDVIKLKPESAEPHYNLGVVYMATGRLAEAVGELKRSIEVSEAEKKTIKARNMLAVTYARLGWLDDAEAELNEALKLDPKEMETLTNIKALRELRGKRD